MYISTDLCNIVETPKDLEVLVAGYRMLGKHRKVSRILKECDIRNIDVPNKNIGRQ